MRVLITRPQPDADELAARIASMGHTAFIEPLLNIVFEQGPELDLRQTQALIFTSANGVRATAKRTHDRKILTIAVGPVTAAQARAEGFQNIEQSAGEGVDGLVAFIRTNHDPEMGRLLHVTGSDVAGDLVGNLSQIGFNTETRKLYDALPIETLSQELRIELKMGMIAASLFFSPRTSALFSSLVQKAGLNNTCGIIAAITLSPNVAKSLEPLTFRKLLVAQNATTEAMMKLLATL